jgi:hypothetical protein
MAVLLGAIDKPTNVQYRISRPYKEGDFYVQEVVVNINGRKYKEYDYSKKKETLIKRYKKYPIISKFTFINIK